MPATNKNSATTFLFFIGIVIACARIPNLEFIENSLWGEDGRMFYRWAINRPFDSFFTPYAGYLNTYPRAGAFLATAFDFSLMPYIYFLVWLAACSALIFVILKSSDSENRTVQKIFLLSAILLQPNSGEIFYSLTNSQWFISAAMCIWALNSDREKPSKLEVLAFIIAALTGPFILLMLPALILRVFVLQDLKSRKAVYIATAACSLLQLWCVIFSDRHSAGVLSTNLSEWIKALIILLTFGEYPRSLPMCLFASTFWLIFAASLINVWNDKEKLYRVAGIAGTGLLIFAAGLAATRSAPLSLHPLGEGARYYFPAYTLVVFAAYIATTRIPAIRLTVLAIPIAIGVHSFSKLDRPDLQWHAYAAFAKTIHGVSIPENPMTPAYPGWGFSLSERLVDTKKAPKARLPTSIRTEGQFVIIGIPDECSSSRYVGLSGIINKSEKGLLSLKWDYKNSPSRNVIFSRFYDAGESFVFFAIKKPKTHALTIFNQEDQSMPISLSDIKLYCEN